MDTDLAPNTQPQGSWSTQMDYRTPNPSGDAMPPADPAEAGSPAHELLQLIHRYPKTAFNLLMFMVVGYFIANFVCDAITTLVFGK